MMLKTSVYSFADMQKRVLELGELATQQEHLIQSQFNQMMENTNPLTIVKESINSLLKDKSIQENLSTTAVKLGANFVIEKVLGRNRSVLGYLSSILVEKYGAPLLKKILPSSKGKLIE